MKVLFKLNSFQMACEELLRGVGYLVAANPSEDEVQIVEDTFPPIPDAPNPTESRRGSHLRQETNTARHLHFLPIYRQSVLTYVVRVITKVMTESDGVVSLNDAAIGHIFVMLQVQIGLLASGTQSYKSIFMPQLTMLNFQHYDGCFKSGGHFQLNRKFLDSSVELIEAENIF